MAEVQTPLRELTEEDLALLRHSDLAPEGPAADNLVEPGSPAPAGFRERLTLGDLSW